VSAPDGYVIRGGATDEEIAAVLAVLTALAGAATTEAEPLLDHPPRYARRSERLRRSVSARGPDAWRTALRR
jgi:hypothetical protein